MIRINYGVFAALYGSAALLLTSPHTNATEAIIIGGGPNVHSSHVQIEQNVKWVQNILDSQQIPTTTYFTDGNAPGSDVRYQLSSSQHSDTQNPSSMEAISRVFGDGFLERQRYREHNIDAVSGSTRLQDLEPALKNNFSRSDDDMLLVFNGHGTRAASNAANASIDLWDNTQLTVGDLHSWLNERRLPVRFVFTQCYSGAFHRLAYQDPAQGLELSDVRHCGFTSESAYQQAESCSASIDTNDYRDYSSYFFSAFHGYERDGEIISRFPDTNADDVVSLREAHLFTLQEAFSTDLPRSTSEDFLLQWQPWYLRWMPNTKYLPNNEYARLFRDIATAYKIDLSNDVAKTIRQLKSDHELAISELEEQMAATRVATSELQFQLQQSLSAQWPQLLSPYTSEFNALVESGEIHAISKTIHDTLSDFPRLVELQSLAAEQETQLLQLQRQVTQCHKLLHLRQLAYLKQQLSDYGSTEEKNAYQSLLQCESEPITAPGILTTDATQ